MGSERYYKDRGWSDQYIPKIKEILGTALIQKTGIRLDNFCGTDFLLPSLRVACRLRRKSNHSLKWRGEVTFRNTRKKEGIETEWDKIQNGMVDVMLYGHAAIGEISPWVIVDLRLLRFVLQTQKKALTMGEKKLKDGTCFVWIDLLKSKQSVIQPMIINQNDFFPV